MNASYNSQRDSDFLTGFPAASERNSSCFDGEIELELGLLSTQKSANIKLLLAFVAVLQQMTVEP